MAHKLTLKPLANQRGLTLVELMIVVAILGILASLAGVAFFKQIKNAKMTQMEQYAMDIARGQEEFFSRHGTYYPTNNSTVATFSGSDAANSGTRRTVRQVMGFDHADLPADVTIRISAGSNMDSCSPTVCINGYTTDTTATWYAVSVQQDLDPGETANSTIIVSSSNQKPFRMNEGL